MKRIRFGEAGRERPGVLLRDGTRIDASAVGSDCGEVPDPSRLGTWLTGDIAELGIDGLGSSRQKVAACA